jgi:hypothetical protein
MGRYAPRAVDSHIARSFDSLNIDTPLISSHSKPSEHLRRHIRKPKCTGSMNTSFWHVRKWKSHFAPFRYEDLASLAGGSWQGQERREISDHVRQWNFHRKLVYLPRARQMYATNIREKRNVQKCVDVALRFVVSQQFASLARTSGISVWEKVLVPLFE